MARTPKKTGKTRARGRAASKPARRPAGEARARNPPRRAAPSERLPPERARLLEHLPQAQGLLEAVVRRMPGGVILAGAPSGRPLLWNDAVEQFFDLPVPPTGGLARRRRFEWLRPDGRPYLPEELPLERSLRTGEVVTREKIVVRRDDGSRATLLESAAPIRGADGCVLAAVMTFLDVSGEEAERERTDAEQLLLAEIGGVLGGFLDVGQILERTARLVVPTFADGCILDLQEDGEPLRQAAIAHVDPGKEELARELARRQGPDLEPEHGVGYVLREGRADVYPELLDERWTPHPLGDEHPALLRELGARSYVCVPLETRGKAFGALSLVRGEGGPRYDDRSLRLAEELGRRLSAAIENAWLYRTAVDALRMRNDFFSVASHELKTPLGALLLQVQKLQRIGERTQGAGIPLEAQVKSLSLIERQVRKLLELTNAVLDFSRIASGTVALRREDVDLADLVGETISRFEELALRAGSVVVASLARPSMGRWDRMRLEQVVSNLLSNAIKYGAGKPIDVSVEVDPAAARLVVRDGGIGIAQEDLTRVFGRFERAVSPRHYAGLGMGLYLTRQIVEAHGGTIRVTSLPGEGSTFVVELPREAHGQREPPPAPPAGQHDAVG